MKKNLLLTSALLILRFSLVAQAPDFSWVKSVGSPSWDEGHAITVDKSGNVYTTGFFYGTADFDPGNNVYNLTSNGYPDIFISKVDASGHFAWAKNIGGANYDMGYAITTDAAGNVYTTGYYSGTVDFDPGPGVYNLTTPITNMNHVFISKLDSAGNFIWAKQIGGNAGSTGVALLTDASANIYITGDFSGIADFDRGLDTVHLTATGNHDIFVAKMDSTGKFAWAKAMNSTDVAYGMSIARDAAGSIYITGYFTGTVDLDPGSGTYNLVSSGGYDIYIAKLDGSGNFIWAKQIGSPTNDDSRGIAVDAAANVYTTGSFSGTADFDPGAGTFNMTAGHDVLNVFISKLDSAGNFIWAKQIGGNGFDYSHAVALDSLANVYLAGSFSKTADFDPNAGTYNLTSAGGVGADIFLARLDSAGNFTWAKQIGGTDGSSSNSSAAASALAVVAPDSLFFTGLFYSPELFVDGITLVNADATGSTEDIITSGVSPSIFTAVKENNTQNNTVIYPNPAKDDFDVRYTTKAATSFALYNVLGEKVISKDLNPGATDMLIKTNDLNDGIYFWRIADLNNKAESGKIIISK